MVLYNQRCQPAKINEGQLIYMFVIKNDPKMVRKIALFEDVESIASKVGTVPP